MNLVIKIIMVLLLSTPFIMACSSSPEPKNDPYNDADSQRSRADKSQRELSSETIRD